MKVLQVMPEFGLAGAEIMCECLLKGLRDRGHEVLAVSLYDYHSAITERLERVGIQIKYLGKKSGFDAKLYKKLYRIIKEFRPDVVHTHRYVMAYAVPAAKFAGVKRIVHTIHNVATKEQGANKRKLANFFFNRGYVIPVALSKEIQKSVLEEYKLLEAQVPIVFNGEDLSQFHIKSDYTFKDTFKICHIGRFQPVKNQMAVVKAAKNLYDANIPVEFFIFGDNNNEYGNHIKNMVSELNAEKYIHLEGTTDKIAESLSNSDAFVLPSQYEGMPMTLIEAMASALPIVASAVGGIPDMLENNNSALLINGSEDELTHAIRVLYESESLRRKLGQNAQKKSGEFSSQKMSEAYESIYAN